MSKQDSQHVELETAPRHRKSGYAKPYGLKLFYGMAGRRFCWTKWYGTREARERAKHRYAKDDRNYLKIQEIER